MKLAQAMKLMTQSEEAFLIYNYIMDVGGSLLPRCNTEVLAS